jgi:hypothetical protein
VAGDAIFSLYPFPNNPEGAYGPNTFTEVLPAGGAGNLFSLRLDHAFRERKVWIFPFEMSNSFGARYNVTDEISTLPVTGGAIHSSVRPHVLTQSFSSFLNTTLPFDAANTFRLSFSGSNISFQGVRDPGLLASNMFPDEPFLLNAPLTLNVAQQTGSDTTPRFVTASTGQSEWNALAGLAPGSLPQTEAITGPIGQVNVAGFSSLGWDTSTFPQTRVDKTIQVADTFIKTRGRHTITGGFDFWHVSLNTNVNSGARPQVDFWGERVLPSTLPNSPSPSSSNPFLLSTDMVAAGMPQGLYQTVARSPNSALSTHRNQIDFFLEDEVRLAPTLRLTSGLRIELNRLPASDDGRFSDYSTTAFQNDLASAESDCVPTSANYSWCASLINSLTRVAPASFNSVFGAHPVGLDGRVGFAWDAQRSGMTVLRGGIGTYTGQFPEIITTESGNTFPTYLPLNFANAPSGIGSSSGIFLFNPANSIVCVVLNLQNQCNKSPFIQPGTLNQLGTQYAADPMYFVARQANRFSSLNLVQPTANLHNPYSVQFGLTVDQRLTNDFTLSVAYIGTAGRHLLQVANEGSPVVNLFKVASIEPATGVAAGAFPAFTLCTSIVVNTNACIPNATTSTTLRPVGNPQITQTVFETTANSIYNSLQVELRSRPHWRTQLGAAFTWSHSIDDASEFFDTAGSPALPQDSFSPSERASSNFDERVRLPIYFVIATPKRAPRAFRDIQLSGVYVFQTGQPFTVTSAIDVNQDANLTDRLGTTSGLAPGTERRATFVSTVSPYQLLSSNEQALAAQQALLPIAADASKGYCYSSTTLVNLCNGVVGRNTFRMSSMNNLDLALSRRFRIANSESKAIQLRVEAFNALNRAQFGVPVRIVGAPSFGSAVNQIAPNRIVQVALRISF